MVKSANAYATNKNGNKKEAVNFGDRDESKLKVETDP